MTSEAYFAHKQKPFLDITNDLLNIFVCVENFWVIEYIAQVRDQILSNVPHIKNVFFFQICIKLSFIRTINNPQREKGFANIELQPLEKCTWEKRWKSNLSRNAIKVCLDFLREICTSKSSFLFACSFSFANRKSMNWKYT